MTHTAWRPDLVDALQQPIWTARADGTIIRANASWHAVTGIPAGITLGRWWDTAIHPDDIAPAAAGWDVGIRDSDPFEIEFRLRHAGGAWRWHLARIAPMPPGEADEPAWVAIALDIDERRKAREARRASEVRLRELIANADDIIYTLGLDGMLTDINPAVERVLGYTPEEMMSLPFERIVVPDQVPYTRGMLERKLAGEPSSIYELDVIAKDGRRVTLEINSRLIEEDGRPIAIHGVARDISNRRQRIQQAELSAAVGTALTTMQALGEQLQAAAQAIVDHLGVAFARIWLIDNDDPELLVLHASAGQYTHLDGAHSRIRVGEYKIGRIAARREPFLSNDVATDPEISDREWARREGMTAFAGYPLVLGDHLLGVVGLFARHRLDSTTQSVLSSVTDTIAVAIERTYAEHARDTVLAREQEARVWAEVAETRYRNLFEGVADAILVADSERHYLDANAATSQLLGYTRAELLQMRVEDIVVAEPTWTESEFKQFVEDIVVAEPTWTESEFNQFNEKGQWRGELALRHKDGTIIPVEARATVVRLPAGPVFMSAVRDITERKHLERLQRDFLAMVTHDIRTPLTSVKGWMQLLQRRPYLEARDRRIVSRSLEQTETIAHLIDDLADLVRIEVGQLQLHRRQDDLLGIIREQIALVQEHAEHHRLRLETAEEAITGAWDRRRVGQVLQNLLTNAVKYSADGGDVTVRVARAGDEARIEVEDQGIGISPDHLPLLFERFYREEATGAGGLGLGLHITRMLVETHGGAISAVSEQGTGSVFIVTLPIVSAA
ncbi:MAG TPA: PAS domain S-box protein [Thermomicrobiales bacterium]|nr:PAS domain S-box protein [Thermomicrobiales bacterium]